MNNRKAPIVLFSFLVIAIAGMAVFNASQNSQSAQDQHQHQEEAVAEHTPTADERAAASNSALSALDKGGNTTNRKAAMANEGGSDPQMGMAKEPTILVRKFRAYRPLPNDAGTATQWYREESRSHQIAEENSKGKG